MPNTAFTSFWLTQLWQRYLDLGQQQDKDLRPESLNRVRTQEERWEQEQERFQHKHDRERQNRERRDRKRRDREQKREEKERRKRARRLRQIQMLQLLKAPLQVLLLALLSSILFVLLAVLALALVGWFTFIGLLVTVVAYLLLIISRATICADFAFLSFKGSLSVPARAPKLLASEAGRIKALGCRLLRAQGLRRNGRTPLWRADAAENRLR
ncbi:hypothetical protein B0H16DRAFT_998579 [Mycena metata]|uniref:Uncharacterized protein n=1 Tax=Mycena metata TaxID=1033252 RepID=A0AAD7N3A7_9AGAR|nr:hypothetical protein B0H16DRAFT_998579 [Mycena metata]